MISRPPYGYRLIRKTETCGARLEIDANEAAIVRRIYDLYAREGLKMNAVSQRLDAEGVRPRHAELWPTATVAVILRNEAYVGKAAYLKTVGTGRPSRRNRTGRLKGGAVRNLTGRTARPREEWIELPVPAIVETSVFAQAQRRRAENRRFSPRKTADPTLLQGLCVCAECGYTIGRHSGSGGRGGRVHYYRCHGIDSWRRPQGAVCDNPPVRADALDAAIWTEMLTLLENPELVQREIDRRLAAANDTDSHDRRMAALRAESSRNETRMSRLLDAYQEGLVTLDALRERNAPLQTRQRAILSELDALQTSQLNRESQLALATTVKHFLGRMREAARSLSVIERQRIVRLLVREVRVGKESVTICHSIPMNGLPPLGSQSDRGGPVAIETTPDRRGLLVPRCGQVVEHQRAVLEMPLGQAPLDGALAFEQPVHGGVQVVLVDVPEPERHGERVARGGLGEAAGGGQLRARVEDAGSDQGQHALALGAGDAGDGSVEAQLAQGPEHGGDMAVGQGAFDVEGTAEVGDGGAAAEQGAQPFDECRRPFGEVGEGAFFDFAGDAVGLAQEDGRGGAAVGNGLDVHGHVL